MAATARDLRYRQVGYVDGNLARDLDWAVRERELTHAGETPRRQEAVQPKVRQVPQVRVREKQHVSLLAVTGIGAVIVMAVMVIMSYIQLTMLAADTVVLKNELLALESENVTLTAQYEQMFDLSTVRQAALSSGMRKVSASQVCYLDLSGGDSVVVHRQEEVNTLSRVLTSLQHGIYAAVEYFE